MSIVLLLGLNYCSKKAIPATTLDNKEFKEYLKNGFEANYNPDSTYAVIYAHNKINNYYHVLILRLKNDSIIYSQNLFDPKFNWLDTFKIEIDRGLGFVNNTNGREVYTFDVVSYQKIIIKKDYKRP